MKRKVSIDLILLILFSFKRKREETHHDERLALEGHGPCAREKLELRSDGHLVPGRERKVDRFFDRFGKFFEREWSLLPLFFSPSLFPSPPKRTSASTLTGQKKGVKQSDIP